ncbi:hypothetical protein Tcan_05854 [Toxocara canis]|uniref:Uncharacterized protein n=1 Tax=Toxocara canis TaxID=6265 RepID=A0A0B2VB25_TOXCA|nr:hypothetical protein Tcan_05854 [Toxocara canis]
MAIRDRSAFWKIIQTKFAHARIFTFGPRKQPKEAPIVRITSYEICFSSSKQFYCTDYCATFKQCKRTMKTTAPKTRTWRNMLLCNSNKSFLPRRFLPPNWSDYLEKGRDVYKSDTVTLYNFV